MPSITSRCFVEPNYSLLVVVLNFQQQVQTLPRYCLFRACFGRFAFKLRDNVFEELHQLQIFLWKLKN
jgi:hypothetical protein